MEFTLQLRHAQELMGIVFGVIDEDRGRKVALCIVNTSGHQLLACRQDGVKMASVGFAYNKAVTAINCQQDTTEFGEMMEGLWVPGDPSLALARSTAIPNFCGIAGGVLLYEPVGSTGVVVGALGISNRLPHEDHELAKMAAESDWGLA